jgi:hypothetical protein
MALTATRPKAFQLIFFTILVPWIALLVRFMFFLAEEVPNVIGRRIFTVMVLWMIATHAVTVIVGPWAAWQTWRGRMRGFITGVAIAANLGLHTAAVLLVAGLGGLEYLATFFLSAVTLVALVAMALRGRASVDAGVAA